jgi:hypothetical protein
LIPSGGEASNDASAVLFAPLVVPVLSEDEGGTDARKSQPRAYLITAVVVVVVAQMCHAAQRAAQLQRGQ